MRVAKTFGLLMNFTVEKPKTWKGLSYPLKTSMLKEAFDMHGIDCSIDLVYWTPKNFADRYNILECEFWPANHRVNYDRFFIRAGVVKAQDRKLAETLLKDDVIPMLLQFMKNKLSQDSNSTRFAKGTYFLAVFTENKVIINPKQGG